MSELKPCPFCGAEAHGYEIEAHQHSPALLALCPGLPPEPEGRYVIEGRCACGSGLIGDSQEEVTERWNRRAQPAQAGQVLTDEKLWEMWVESPSDVLRFARAIEQAVMAKRVPMTQAEMLAAFAMEHPQDHADMQDGSHTNAVERIGARAVYRRFERGIRAAEKFHGIVGEKGGA